MDPATRKQKYGNFLPATAISLHGEDIADLVGKLPV
jgi:hypothetical protein